MSLNWNGSRGQYHAFEQNRDDHYRHCHIVRKDNVYRVIFNHFVEGKHTVSREYRRKTLPAAKKVAGAM